MNGLGHAAYGATDVGTLRQHNEDHFLIDDELGLYVVCDGLGGRAAGEVASRLTAEVVQRVLQENAHVLRGYADAPCFLNRARAHTLVELAVNTASREVHRAGLANTEHTGMASTIVLLLVLGGHAVVAHVGDSRLYVWREGQQVLLTEDHSFLREQVRGGLISASAAAQLPKTGLMSRAIGVRDTVEVDIGHLELLPGDLFLLCSDGLSDYFSGTEFGEIRSSLPVDRVPDALVAFANRSGGKDNITAVIVEIDASLRTTGAEVSEKLETLRRIPLFADLTDAELMLVLNAVRFRSCQAGDVLIGAGEDEHELYITLSGRLEVRKGDRVLQELGPGSFFGEMALLDAEPRSADVVAREASRFMVVRRQAFRGLLEAEPQLGVKLLLAFCQALNHRLRRVTSELPDAAAAGAMLASIGI